MEPDHGIAHKLQEALANPFLFFVSVSDTMNVSMIEVLIAKGL